jgi:hypothetical protein
MSGKTTGLNTLESRKQLLLLESELNRAHLVNEWQDVQNGVCYYLDQARAVSSIASSAARITTSVASLFSGGSSYRRDEEKKPTVISTLFKGARAGFSLWSKLRAK